MIKKDINPITRLDYPDPDVIRVDDTYYMVSTTMYFMPGCEILRSYDLVNWEHATYVYDKLDSTPAQRLEGKENIYGQGMWAASLRFHNGVFYICFVANDTHKTYIYQSKDIYGPWEKYCLNGFYHDNSILFDDDGRIYIVSGNKEIHIKELKLQPKESCNAASGDICNKNLSDKAGEIPTYLTDDVPGGLDMIIVKDSDDVYLGYEGAHFYKINDKYYLFFIHMPKSIGKRAEAVFVSDRPEGPYVGKDVMYDDRGYRSSGVAQGGIVETPGGKWYSILFQDSGAVGRIPVLMPVHFTEDDLIPVFGDNGKIPEEFEIEDLRPGYEYTPLVGSDDFKEDGFKPCWQFNHEPDLSFIKRDPEKGTVTITTDKLSSNLVQAKNTLTQRTLFPGCKSSVEVDGSALNEGDFAGLCVLESNYGLVGITRRNGDYFLVMGKREITTGGFWGERHDDEPFEEVECVKLDSPKVTLYSSICFDRKSLEIGDPIKKDDNSLFLYGPKEDDTALFFYSADKDASPTKIGSSHKLRFVLDHFTGARYGLFVYSTKKVGGSATFSNFRYLS